MTCPHGYLDASCAECRRAALGQHTTIVSPIGAPKTTAEIAERQAAITAELQRMDASPAAGEDTHGELRDRLVAELDALRTERTLLARSEAAATRAARIADITRMAADESNLERPDGSQPGGPGAKPGAPAYVKGLGDRLETPAETIQRMGDPWRMDARGPLDRETGRGLIARCHDAISGQEERLTRSGAQMLANLMSERPDPSGPYEIRGRDDVERAAGWVLSLSNPHYQTAFEKILASPEAFRNGTGILLWSDEERAAYSDVQDRATVNRQASNHLVRQTYPDGGEISRAALIENTGTGGTYWLPLYLDDTVVLQNAGAASPWRKMCRVVQTTSNTWNGVASAGVNAQWLAEGTLSADATPTITQLQVPVWKEAAWVMASYELGGVNGANGDQPNLARQIPTLIADARLRLEEASFVTGAGTSTPAGVITRATVDGSTGLVSVANAVSVLSLLTNLPPRFRAYDTARPFWACNIAILNALRGVTAFTAATQSIVVDSTPDGVPEMFSIDVMESTTMDAVNTTGGHKNLILMDGNSYLVVDRVGTQMIYEPLVPGAGGINPAGISGWFFWARVGADTSAATGLRVHNNV